MTYSHHHRCRLNPSERTCPTRGDAEGREAVVRLRWGVAVVFCTQSGWISRDGKLLEFKTEIRTHVLSTYTFCIGTPYLKACCVPHWRCCFQGRKTAQNLRPLLCMHSTDLAIASGAL